MAIFPFLSISCPNTHTTLQVLAAHFDNKLLLEVPRQLWENPVYSRRIVSIHLENNFLSSLPEPLTALTTLRLLSLAGNRLAAVPEWLPALPSLDTLSFASNCLTALPPTLGDLPRLAHLNVYDNRLQRIPTALGRCAELRTLVIGRNPWVPFVPEEEGLSPHVGLPAALLANMRALTARSFCNGVCEFLRLHMLAYFSPTSVHAQLARFRSCFLLIRSSICGGIGDRHTGP